MKTNYKALKALQKTVCMTTGVVAGALASIAIVGFATSVTGKILGGMISYLAVAGATDEAMQKISDPLIDLVKPNNLEDEKA